MCFPREKDDQGRKLLLTDLYEKLTIILDGNLSVPIVADVFNAIEQGPGDLNRFDAAFALT